MPKVYVSNTIDAPIEEVWETIRPFSSLSEWHPWIEECHIEAGLAEDQIGAVRTFKWEGNILRERLVEMSDVNHSIRIALIESPFPLQYYQGYLRLSEVRETAQTLAEWSNDFELPDDQKETLAEEVEELFRVGIENLKQILE